MCVMRNNIVWVIFLIIIYDIVEALPTSEQQHNTRSFRNALNQQGMQSLLQSIENRLSNLDQIYSHRYSQSQRIDSNSDQYVRKIEILESKLSRLEVTLDAQLDKLSENLSSKKFRDDITKDQIFRKIDSLYERFNHKLTYIEEKFDMAVLKLQNKIDIGVTKIERLDASINVRNADIESEIAEGVQIIKTVKNNVDFLEEKIVNVSRFSLENLEKINIQQTNITKSLSQIENKLVNISSRSRENYLNDFSKTEPAYNYSNKINNMYNELWKKSNEIETDIKNSVQLMNLTRKEIQDNFSDIKKKTANLNNNQNDGTLDIMLDSFTNYLQRKFTDLGRKMEDNFETIMATQNLFLESCHRIQMDETQLETKISLVLEKLLDSLSNRSLVTFKELQNTEEVIKTQNNQVERLINQNTNTIMKLSEKTSDDRKKIEKILSTIKKDFANFIEHNINLESLERSDKLDNIGDLILKLQGKVNDLDRKMNKDNINYNAKQMVLQDILEQTKDLFAKQLNISVLHNTITKVDNIHQLLNNIGYKINKTADVQLHLHKFNDSQINFDYEQEILKPNENVDIVFDESDKNIVEPKINLFRYNYSIIDDKNDNNKNIIDLYTIQVPQIKTDINNDKEFINPYFSSEESSEEFAQESNITNYSNKNKQLNISKDENITLEKPKVSHDENKSKIQSTTNNILSIDNDTETIESSINENKSPTTPIINIPPSDSDKTSKIENNGGVDIFEELYDKFFGGFLNVQPYDDSSEYSDKNKPETNSNNYDSIGSTTDIVDNTDYEDNFYE